MKYVEIEEDGWITVMTEEQYEEYAKSMKNKEEKWE